MKDATIHHQAPAQLATVAELARRASRSHGTIKSMIERHEIEPVGILLGGSTRIPLYPVEVFMSIDVLKTPVVQ